MRRLNLALLALLLLAALACWWKDTCDREEREWQSVMDAVPRQLGLHRRRP